MITKKDLCIRADLTQQGLDYRLKQMEKTGIKIKAIYQQTDRAPIRIFTNEIAEAIINWRGAKPGRKKQK